EAEEMTRFINPSLNWPIPIYIRLAKGGDPIVSKPENGFTLGKAIAMHRAARGTRPIALMENGVMTTNCLGAGQLLGREGHETTLVHFHTIKPLDEDVVVEHASHARLV